MIWLHWLILVIYEAVMGDSSYYVTAIPHTDSRLRKFHRDLFPSDPEPHWAGCWTWLIFQRGGEAVGFLALEEVPSWPGSIFVSRVGVIPAHRGKGLQLRLLKTAQRFARSWSLDRLLSSTYENPASANNFIRAGYRTYLPSTPWGAAGTVYWLKDL